MRTDWIPANTPPSHSKSVMVLCQKGLNRNDVYEARYFKEHGSDQPWCEADQEYDLYGVIWWAEIPSQTPAPA